jgi:hypothetical protein
MTDPDPDPDPDPARPRDMPERATGAIKTTVPHDRPRTAAQTLPPPSRLLEPRIRPAAVGRADIDAGWDDLVDPVEHFV